MKMIHWYSMIVLFITVFAFTACKEMDSTYKEFIVPGGLSYLGKATSPIVYGGHNRVKISWLRGADPNVIKARVFWNNYTDSVEINIPLTKDTISVIIDNLPEKPYTFEIRTYDEKGNFSIPVEVLGESFGEKYQAQLLNRPVNSTSEIGKSIRIAWGSADISNGAVASEIKYTDTTGMLRTLKVATDVNIYDILDYKKGNPYQYRSVFVPGGLAIDTFYTSFVQSGMFSLDKTFWKVIAYSSQYDATTNAAIQFIDGSVATRWHSLISPATGNNIYPNHYITIDMGAQRIISQFGVARSTYGTAAEWIRAPDKIKFEVSTNNINWTDLGVFDFNRFIDGEQSFNIPSSPTRYIKFRGISGPYTYMGIGEIWAYGF